MSASEHLRLAWQADRAGQPRLRDVMLTLAVAESDPADGWPERGRSYLLRNHPGHFFGRFENLSIALTNSEVQNALSRLREKYPEARVEWLLLAGDVSRGLYTGRDVSRSILVNDLLGSPAEAEVRRDTPEPIRGPYARSRTAVAARVGIFPAGSSVFDVTAMSYELEAPQVADEPESPAQDESLSCFYLSVLFSMALLLSITQGKPQELRRAG